MSLQADRFATKVCQEQVLTKYDFADELMCKLCSVNIVGNSPQLTKCSHLFCGDCLDAHWETCNNTVECPVCAERLDSEHDVYSVEKNGTGASAFVWRMLSTLRVHCNRSCGKAGSCNWIGEYGAYTEHVQSGECGTNTDVEEQPSACVDDESERLPGMLDLQSSIRELMRLKTLQAETQPHQATVDSSPTALDTDGSDDSALESDDAPAENHQQGMDNLCSLVESLIRLKQKDQQHDAKRAADNSRSPTASTRGTRSSTVSISDALDLDEDVKSSSSEERMPTTPKRSALNLSASIQAPEPQVKTPPAATRVTPVKKQAQGDMMRYMQAAQTQHAAHVMQWQRASMAYASQMQAAQYQMAADAYRTQAARCRQAAVNQ